MTIQPIANSNGTGYPSGGAPETDAGKAPPVPPSTSVAAARAVSPPTPREVRKAVSDINSTIQSLVSHLEFFVDENTQATVVKVVDTRTKEVIREFSTVKVLGIAKALDKVQGLLLRESA